MMSHNTDTKNLGTTGDVWWDQVFTWLLADEGLGVENVEHDPGGETAYGLTKRELTEEHWTRVVGGDLAFIQQIYWEKYWIPIHGGMLDNLLAYVVFDTAVHIGVNGASRMLQRILPTYKGNQDGIIGPLTLDAVEQVERCNWTIDTLCLAILAQRFYYYGLLIERNKDLGKFKIGWNNRLNKVRKRIMEP